MYFVVCNLKNQQKRRKIMNKSQEYVKANRALKQYQKDARLLVLAWSVFIALAVTVILSGCGGSTPETVKVEPIEIIKPVIDTLVIHRNTEYKYGSMDGMPSDAEAVITSVVFSQKDRERLLKCNYTCFIPALSVILGDDKDCVDCKLLTRFLDPYESRHGMTVFLVIEDALTFSFAQHLAGKYGHSNVVLVSSNEELLLKAEYNYPLAIIGESTDSNIDWHITSNSECSAKCINPNGEGLGEFDGTIKG